MSDQCGSAATRGEIEMEGAAWKLAVSTPGVAEKALIRCTLQ